MRYLQWGFVIACGLTFGVELEIIGPRVLAWQTLGLMWVAYGGFLWGWAIGHVEADQKHARDCPYEHAVKKGLIP